MLRRTFQGFDLTARGTRAPERRWLVEGRRPPAAESFSLGLDFGRWLQAMWPHVQTAMDLSWMWRETDDGESDGRVRWKLEIGW